MEPNKRKRTTLWIVLTIVFVGSVYGGVRWWRSERVEKMLQEYATSLNIRCPRELEPGMTLKRVVVLPGRTLVYNVESEVLTCQMVQDSIIDLSQFRENARNNAVQALLADPSLPRIRRLGITFVYNYKYLDGTPMMDFTVTPEDYR